MNDTELFRKWSKKITFRKCKICRKMIFKDKDMLCIVLANKKDKRSGWYHLSCMGPCTMNRINDL